MITIDEAISYSERRAKRLWLVGILWLVIMVIVAFIFGISIYQFNSTRHELDHLRSVANKLITQIWRRRKKSWLRLRIDGALKAGKFTLFLCRCSVQTP